jgi:tetratricopeptide (TPR) repeat protein
MSTMLVGDLRQELARGRVIVLVGAGVSVGATKGAPVASWTGLLEDGVARCEQLALRPLPAGWGDWVRKQLRSGDVETMILAAEAVTNRLGGREHGEYRRWLRETVGELSAGRGEVVEALRDLGAILATTNYDGLLEAATGLPAVTWQDQARVHAVLRGAEEAILHLHGFWREPTSVVLGVRSYQQLLGDEHAQLMQQVMVAVGTLLFVGFGAGLTDPNFEALRAWMSRLFKGGESRHFRLAKDDEVASVRAEHGQGERMFVLGYGPEHADLARFLRGLSPTPPPAAPGMANAPALPARPKPATPRFAGAEPDASDRDSALLAATPAVESLRATGRFAYQDFDLLLEQASQAGTYRARVLRAPAGESGPVDFALPFDPLELENFLLRVGRPRRGGTRRIDRPEVAALKIFGGRLYTAVFQDELHELLLRSLSETSRQGMGLRLRLRLADTPELAGLPWEFLYDQDRNRFLALSKHTPLVRYLELPDPPRPLSVTTPLRVLVMIASPTDYDRLNVEREWSKLQEALGEVQAAGRVAVERLPAATLTALQRQLRQGEWHIFHFIGHGGFDAQRENGVLILEDRSGRSREVSGDELGGLLNDHDSMRLAVLNACESARGDAANPFAGTAQSLIQQGLPAVVAMQFEITDEAAIIFARELYEAVADGYPLDGALAEARKAIQYDGNLIEWGTPVLYSRVPDGRIFDLPGGSQVNHARAAVPAAPESGRSDLPQEEQGEENQQSEQELGALWTDGVAAYFQGSWSEAVAALSTIVDRRPDYQRGNAKAKLDEARRQLELSRRYDAGCAAQKDGSWLEAISHFEAVAAVDQQYGDVERRLEEVRRKEELATLQASLRRRHQAGKWTEVIQLGERIEAAYPEAGDPEGLVASARAELARTRRAEESARQLGAALGHIEAGAWREAIEVLERLQREDAGYRARDITGLLARTRSELANAEEEQRQRQLAEFYNAGRLAEDAGSWPEAIERFEAALTIDGKYRDAAHRLEFARRQRTLDGLRAQAQRLHQARSWKAVLELGARMRQLDPEAEPDPVVAAAQAKLAEAEHERESRRRYDAACHAMEAGEWQQALEALEALEQLHPGYRDTAVLLGATRRELMKLVISGDERVLALAFAGGSRVVLATTRTAEIWDLTRRRRMRTLAHSPSPASALAFSIGAEYLAVGATDGAVRVWQWANARGISTLRAGAVHAAALSADGQRLAAASGGGTAVVWDIAGGNQIVSFRHTDTVLAVALSPDGTRLATGSIDKTARVWDIASRAELLRAPHDRTVLAVALSPDGTRLATGSTDKTARVWDIVSGRKIAEFRHDSAVQAVALSPDGIRLATGSDKMAQVLGLE